MHSQAVVVTSLPTVICLTAAIMFLCARSAQDFPGAPWVWQQAHRHPCVAALPPAHSFLAVSSASCLLGRPCPAARHGTESALGSWAVWAYVCPRRQSCTQPPRPQTRSPLTQDKYSIAQHNSTLLEATRQTPPTTTLLCKLACFAFITLRL